MSLQIPADLEQFVQSEIAGGTYPDRDALIVDALRLLRRERAEELAGFRAGLQDALEGRCREMSEVFADIERDAGMKSA